MLAEMGTAAGMLEGIVTWARERRRPDNARTPGVIALETTRVQRTAMFLIARSRRVVTLARSMPPAQCSVAPRAGSIRVTQSGPGAPAGPDHVHRETEHLSSDADRPAHQSAYADLMRSRLTPASDGHSRGASHHISDIGAKQFLATKIDILVITRWRSTRRRSAIVDSAPGPGRASCQACQRPSRNIW